MSRVVVIGATGHIGSYLVPRLARGGHEVIAMSRGIRGPYLRSPRWDSVTTVTVDRDAADAEGSFGDQVAALRPDVVIDLICFTAASARQLVDALRPSRPLLIHCGTIWVHGPALRVPVTEDEPRTAYGEYGTGKAEIEALLHRETLAGGVPAVVLHPGHISGPGWPVITPAGNLDPAVWTRLATGRPLALPDNGLGVLNHVHADDAAQAFERAISRPAAIGASFHVVAEQAMTLRGDRKSTRLNSSHSQISYAVFCLKKKNQSNCNTLEVVHLNTATPMRPPEKPLWAVSDPPYLDTVTYTPFLPVLCAPVVRPDTVNH